MRSFIAVLTLMFGITIAFAADEPPHQFSQQPPPPLQDLSFAHRMIVCKTAGEIEQIVEAEKQSVGGLQRTHEQFAAKHECSPGWVFVSFVTTGESEDLGEVTIGGVRRHFYRLHVGNIQTEFHCLYDEGSAPDPDLEHGTGIGI